MGFAVFDRIMRRGRSRAAAAVGLRKGRRLRPNFLSLEGRRLLSVNIEIDYTYDTSDFFNTPLKQELMQDAADVVAGALSSGQLSAITPTGSNTWTATFPNPSTGATQQVSNLSVPADTIIIYVGGRPLTGSGEAGDGSTGGFSAAGDQAWLDDVASRGKAGALGATPSSFGPWGGSIAFDTGSTNWFFGTTTAGLTAGETDFFTVAEHEIGHVLGIGTSDAWFSHVSGDTFDGPAAMAVYGGPVPLAPGLAHWAEGTMSDGVDAVMDPELAGGTRSMFTDLDYAGLADIGWVVQPPAQASTLQFGAASYTVSETGDEATITVDRSGGAGSLTVNYATADGTAQAGLDYQATSGTLYFGVGQTSQTFTVPVLSDPFNIDGVTLTLCLSDPGPDAAIGPQSTATLTISGSGPTAEDDFNGDDRTDFGVFRPSTAQWFIAGDPNPITFGAGNLTDIPVPGNYYGTGQSVPAVFRPSTAQWYIAGNPNPITFGAPNLIDIPVPGDYDGNGETELAVYRPSTAQWYIAGDPNPISFGAPNLDIPVPGDYYGDGRTELAVFRPTTGQWFIAGDPNPISFGGADLFDIPLEGVAGSLFELGLSGDTSSTAIAAQSTSVAASSTSTATAAVTSNAIADDNAVAASLPAATAEVSDAAMPATSRKPDRSSTG